MLKKFVFLLLPLLLFVISVSQAIAAEKPHFVSFVNPVRGEEGWIHRQSPLDLPTLQYTEATKSAFPVTWLLRYDALQSATISAFFRDLTATDSSQTLGAFLEITPKLTAAVGVEYPWGETMTAANRIFLSGYSQADRIRLIDAYMSSFYDVYSYYPSVVGAWHIDAYSLGYLSRRYSVIAAVICDEQYTTDNYRFWGSYLGSPYFPAKLNSLVPATTRENRIPIALTKWAARDPFNFYGTRSESAYSFQVNDYTAMGQSTKFFEDLLGVYSQEGFNEFSQINVGLENDYDISAYRNEIKKTYAFLKKNQGKYNLKFISLSDFGTWMANRYTFTNPAFFYQTGDITGRQVGKVYWYQNPFYRLGLRSAGGQTQIVDFRLYNQAETEEHYLTKNIAKMLYAETNPLVDSVKYPGTALKLDLDLAKAEISSSGWKVAFREGDSELKLEPQKIIFTNLAAPALISPELKVNKTANQTIWVASPKLPFTASPQTTLFTIALIISVVFLLLRQTKNKKAKFILLVGWLIGSLSLTTVGRSGLVYLFGLGFWGPNGHDALFHLSLGENFRLNPFSLAHPQLAGEILKNYHFGFDWLTGVLSRLTTTPLMDIYFRLFPLLLVILLVFVTIRLLSLWRYSHPAIFFSLVFMFLAGSAGFIPSVLAGRSLFGGESFFWANQSVSLLLNPPFALSVLVLLSFLFLLEKRPHRLTWVEWLSLSILGGSLVQIKIYAFILLFPSLVLRKKFKLALGIGLFGFLFILPSLGGVNGFPFLFQPLWFARSMFESPDRLYWRQLAQAWQVYENNGIFFKLVLVNIFAAAIFYLGNLWLRVIGLWRVIIGNEPTVSGRLAQTIVLLGLIVPLIFTQQVNPWNTIQFMYYSIFFLGIFTAGQISDWLSKTRNHLLLAICYMLLVLLFLPTTIGTLKDYLTRQSASRISLTELRALDLIRRSPPGVVVSPLTYGNLPAVVDPKPLYVYTSTAYISALTGHPEYLSDTINLDITGFSYSDRVKNVIRLYQTRDPLWVKQFLSENNIVYVYETPFDKVRVRSEDTCLTKIFDSGEINLYKYECHD